MDENLAAENLAVDDFAEPGPNGRGWIDSKGFLGPLKPGIGPRRDPATDSPSGPEIADLLPNISSADFNITDSFGQPFDLNERRAGQAGALVFFRSAVW